MKIEFGKVLTNTAVAQDIFDMHLYAPDIADTAVPGQFLHILCGGFLRRPISVCCTDMDKGLVRIMYEIKGEGTAWLSERSPGDRLNILGPLGNGFPIMEGKRSVIVGGGIGVPPLLHLAGHMENAMAILGFRSKPHVILEQEFEEWTSSVHITTNDGSYGTNGLVTDKLREVLLANETDVIYACGPTVMLKAVAALAREMNTECYVSLEQRMACGIGACLGCACMAQVNGDMNYLHVCKDGPVFAAEVVF